MPRIRWTEVALEDLRSIREHVQSHDPAAARRLGERIRKAVQRLAKGPLVGRKVPEFDRPSLREVIVSPYRIIYALADKEVHVLRVWHGRRDLGATE